VINKLLKISSALLSVLFMFTSLPAVENQWKMVKSEDGIEIYIRSVPGSAIKEYRAVTVVECSLSGALALLDDTGSYTRWMLNCRSAEILQKNSFYERITYTVLSSPWPVADRDITVKSVISQNRSTGAITITLSGLPNYVSVKPGIVRITALNGYWIFEPLGNGSVRITNAIHSEPGGYVPVSLINRSLVDDPYITFCRMRKMVILSQYKNVKYKEIVEK